MGIHNIVQLIRKYSPSSITSFDIKNLKHKIVAIDANLMIYKLLSAVRKHAKGDLTNKVDGKTVIMTHVYTILLKLFGFLKFKIIPIFVFDNKPNKIKERSLKERKTIRTEQAIKYDAKNDPNYFYLLTTVTQSEINDIKMLIHLFGFKYITAKEEADIECSNLLRNHIVDYIVSDDMDILLFGGTNIIKDFSIVNKKNKLVRLETLLKDIGLSHQQLVDVGILLGTDYNKHVADMGPKKAVETIKKFGSIPKSGIEIPNYETVRDYFLKSPKLSLKELHKQISEQTSSPSSAKLRSYLRKFGLNNETVNKWITKWFP